MMIRNASILALVALPLAAQEKAPADYAFYRAFYLERAERKTEDAIKLYQEFLAANAEHRLVGNAANNLVNLLNRVGRSQDADDLEKKYAEALKSVDRRARGGMGGFGGGDRPGRGGPPGAGGMGGGGMSEQQKQFIANLEKSIAQAKEEGDEDRVKRLTERLEQAKKSAAAPEGGQQGGRGGFGGRRSGRGGGMMQPLAEMENDDARNQAVDRLNQMYERFIGMMEQQGQDDRAAEMQKTLDEFNKLAKEKKWAEADKLMAERARGMMGRQQQRGRRGAGGGGLQINREDLRPPLAELTDEKKAEKIKFLVDYAGRQIDQMKEAGQADGAASLQKQMDEFKRLADEKKWPEADKVVEQVQRVLGGGTRSGRGAGGEGGNRRRRPDAGEGGEIK